MLQPQLQPEPTWPATAAGFLAVAAGNLSDQFCEAGASVRLYSVMCCGDERPLERAVSEKACDELEGFVETPVGRLDVCGASLVDRVSQKAGMELNRAHDGEVHRLITRLGDGR
jgi:hypothetical protein